MGDVKQKPQLESLSGEKPKESEGLDGQEVCKKEQGYNKRMKGGGGNKVENSPGKKARKKRHRGHRASDGKTKFTEQKIPKEGLWKRN